MTNDELNVFMLHLVRLPEVRKLTVDQMGLEINFFDGNMNPVHHGMWDILKEICKHDPMTPVSREVLETSLKLKIDAMDDFRDCATEAQQILDFCYKTDESMLSPVIGNMYLQQVALEAGKRAMIEKANNILSAEDMSKYLGGVKHMYQPPKNNETLIDPFMDVETYLKESPKVRTGIDWFDEINGQGLPIGTVNGLLGPTGGGKTMITCQMLTEQARAGLHCLNMTYEQPVGGDITQRICSRMLKVNLDSVRKPYKQWPPEYQTTYLKLRAAYGRYMHVKDMTQPGQGVNGLSDIEDSYNILCDRGQAPVYIIVDWLLPMIKRYLASRQMEPSGENIRSFGYDFLDAAGQFARANEVILLVNHQLDTKTSRASPKYKPVVTDAMEIKAFSYNIDACFLLGNRDKETNIAWFLSDKNRRGCPDEMLVKMEGSMACFVPATGYVADHRGHFVAEDTLASMPVEEEPTDGHLTSGYI